jgi:hypothetical protein
MVLRPVLKVGDSARRSRTITARVIELFNKLTGDRNPFTTTRAEEAARLSRASSCKWRTSELLDAVVAEDFRVPGASFFTGKAGRPALLILRAPWPQPVDLGPGCPGSVDNPLALSEPGALRMGGDSTRSCRSELRRAWDSNPQALAGNGFQVCGRASLLALLTSA